MVGLDEKKEHVNATSSWSLLVADKPTNGPLCGGTAQNGDARAHNKFIVCVAH